MNDPQSPNRFPFLLILALAGGPSLVGALTLARVITSNLWLAVLLTAIYEIIVLICAFVYRVWQRLEDLWSEQAAQLVDSKVKQLFWRRFWSKYKQRYYQFIIYRHRDLDMRGLSTRGSYTLKLENVFVDLNILPMPAHQISADPLNEPTYGQKRGVSVWDLLSSLKDQNFAIIGSPGCGKTTLLKHIALTLVSNKKSIDQWKVPRKLPILLFLRDHIDALRDKPDFSLVDAVCSHLAKWEQAIPGEWVKQQLVKGRCLVLLDGLDEVADPVMRRKMVDWVQKNMGRYEKNRFIVSSRPYGYRDYPLDGVAVLGVNLFTQDQIQRFVHNWYLANELMSAAGRDDLGVRMNAKARANDLIQRMYNKPVLLELAVNPLLLTMITTVHRYRGILPGKRVELYSEICNAFLGKRREDIGVTEELRADQKKQVLQPLAFYMMDNGLREVSTSKAVSVISETLEHVSVEINALRFLRATEDSTGILLEREQGVYAFAHKTFQEYLAATYMKEQNLVELLCTKVESGWWHEAILLYCAQADATPLVEACLNNASPSISSLILAMECEEEALTLRPETRVRLNTLIDQSIEDTNKQGQPHVIKAILSKRIRKMIYLETGIYVSRSLITQAEYHFFLDNLSAPESSYPDHWLGMRAMIGKGNGRTPILGVRPSDAQQFCDWLTRPDSEWQFRLPKSGELQRIAANKEITDILRDGMGYWINEGKDFAYARDAQIASEQIVNKLFLRERVSDIVPDLIKNIVTLIFASNTNKNFVNRVFASYTSQGYNLSITNVSDLTDRFNAVFNPSTTHDYIIERTINLAFNYMKRLGNSLNLDPFLAFRKKILKSKAQVLKTIFDYVEFLQGTLSLSTVSKNQADNTKGEFIVKSVYITDDEGDIKEVKSVELKAVRDFKQRITLFIDDICNALSDVEARKYSGIYIQFLYNAIRFSVLALCTELVNLKNFIASFEETQVIFYESQSLRQSAAEKIEYLLSNFLKVYVAFTFAEARVKGQYPPCEGILIIREYKK